MSNPNSLLQDKLEDATVRIEQIIHFGCMLTDYSMPESVKELFEDVTPIVDDLFPDLPAEGKQEIENGYFEIEWFIDWINEKRRHGYGILFATPVMKPIGEGGRDYSWGHYSTKWIYADTLEEAVDKAVLWAAERRQVEVERAASEAVEEETL